MKLVLLVVSIILLINVGFSFGLLLSTFYQGENDDSSKFSTLNSFFSGDIKRSDGKFEKIIEVLKRDNDIENKYIMSYSSVYSFYTNSKFIFTDFNEGSGNDSVIDWITKKKWSTFDHWFSNTNSIPPQKITSKQIPDYLIYSFTNPVVGPEDSQLESLKALLHLHSILVNPDDQNLPEFLNPIYSINSSKGGIVVYEVNFQE